MPELLLFLQLNLQNGSYWFNLIYLAAFAISYLLLIRNGLNIKIPILNLLTILSGTMLFFLIGCKIVTYSPNAWVEIWKHSSLIPANGKLVLGGLAFGVFGFFLTSRLLKEKRMNLDSFAVAIPLCLAIQRLGCFLYGCCYGIVSNLPWAVRYPEKSMVHLHHQINGFIAPEDLHSLPVHPTQLYEVLNGLIVAFLVYKFRNFWKRPNSAFVSFLILFSTFRFVIEFYKDPTANIVWGESIGMLSGIQWVLLISVGSLGVLLFYNERKAPITLKKPNAEQTDLFRSILVLALQVVLLWFLDGWFDFVEIIAVNVSFLPVIFFTVYQIFKQISVPRYRWLTAASLVLPVFLMSQSLVNPDVKTYNTLSLGYYQGDYQNSHTFDTGSGCGSFYTTDFEQKFKVYAVGYSRTNINPENNKEISYGINGAFGNHREKPIAFNGNAIFEPANEVFLFDLNPYFRFEKNWIGLGAGIHIGNLPIVTENLNEENNGATSAPETGIFRANIYPQAYLRLGPQKIFFADLRLADRFPSALPGLRFQYGIGSGLGTNNGTRIHFGGSLMGRYFSGYFPIQDKFVIEPMYWVGNSNYGHQFSMGLHYRIHPKN